jgi:hypothetical protein
MSSCAEFNSASIGAIVVRHFDCCWSAKWKTLAKRLPLCKIIFSGQTMVTRKKMSFPREKSAGLANLPPSPPNFLYNKRTSSFDHQNAHLFFPSIASLYFLQAMAAHHPAKDVANIKGVFADAELAANHVFEWFTREEESPFLHEYCFSVSSRLPTKCTCLLPVLNTFGQNDSRTLREVSAYVVRFSRMNREDRIREVMGWKSTRTSLKRRCIRRCLIVCLLCPLEVTTGYRIQTTG